MIFLENIRKVRFWDELKYKIFYTINYNYISRIIKFIYLYKKIKIIKLLFQIFNNLRKHLFKLMSYQIMQD